MACTKNTYPVDLKETNNICDITCNLSFDYNNSSNFRVDNYNGIYLNINYLIKFYFNIISNFWNYDVIKNR